MMRPLHGMAIQLHSNSLVSYLWQELNDPFSDTMKWPLHV